MILPLRAIFIGDTLADGSTVVERVEDDEFVELYMDNSVMFTGLPDIELEVSEVALTLENERAK